MVSTKTGEKRKLTSPPADLDYGDAKAVFSHDGRALIFARGPTWQTGGLYFLRLDENLNSIGTLKKISSMGGTHYGGVFLPGDKDILFSVNNALYHYSLKNNSEAHRIMQIDGLLDISISETNKVLAYAKLFRDSKIIHITLDRKNEVKSKSRPFLASTSNERFPRFSPDGTKVLFSSDRSGGSQLWMCDSSGTNLRQLTFFETGPGYGNWSPEGIYFYTRGEKLEEGIWYKHFESGEQKSVLKEAGADFVISPDGKVILCINKGNTIYNVDLDYIENLW